MVFRCFKISHYFFYKNMYILQYNYSNQGFNNGLNDCELCDGCCSKWQTYSELSPEQFLSALWSVLASFSSPFWRHGSQLNCFGEQTAVFRKRERSEKHSVCLCTRPVPNGKVSDQLVNTEEHLQPDISIRSWWRPNQSYEERKYWTVQREADICWMYRLSLLPSARKFS